MNSNFNAVENTDYNDLLLREGLPTINSIDEKDILPGGFRMSKVVTLPHESSISLKGLESLNISGSSQFSELSLDAIIKRINRKKITIVNLKQEDGGFVEPAEGKGAIAFSKLMKMPWWTGEDLAGNRTVEQIEASETALMKSIMAKKKYTIFGTGDSYAPKDNHKILYRIDIAVKRALTEKQMAEEKGLGYVRIPDKKFGNMDFEHVDMFIDFAKKLNADEWVHFHCKKGQSRTTLFMIMYDMLRNADSVSAEDIIKRQGPLGLGGADLFGLPQKEDWDYSFKKGWKEFLYLFHDYVVENKKEGFQKSWSQWAADKNIETFPPVVLGKYYKETTVESLLPDDDGTQAPHTFVINAINEGKLKLQNFRSTQDLWLDASVSFAQAGLKDLHMSGSSQPTKAGLELFVNRLKARNHAPVVVVDLRHDDHLFVNGLNVSSFETKDALLAPRTPKMIKDSAKKFKQAIENSRVINALAIDTLYPKDQYHKRFSTQLAPTVVETPEELATNLGAEYLLIGSKRFSEASDEDVDLLIDNVKKHSSDTWYHFHCKKGKSRTTFFMALFDMMHNADKLRMEDIVRRQKIIGGVDLFDVTPKDPSWSSERTSKIQWISFLARFHEYAKANKASGFAMSWSQWSKEHKDFQPNINHLVVDQTPPKPTIKVG